MDIQNADYFDASYYTTKTEFDMSKSTSHSSSGTGALGNGLGTLAGYMTYRLMYTGTTSTGAAASRFTVFTPGGGMIVLKTAVRVPTLSTVSEEFIAEAGWHDGTATVAISDGAYFRYDRLTSVNWIAVTEAGGIQTTTDTGIAVTTDVTHFKIVFNDDNTSITFYINDALCATHTTNISSDLSVWIQYKIEKSAGIGGRFFYSYYYQYIQRRT